MSALSCILLGLLVHYALMNYSYIWLRTQI
jgi:hypothetical protein